MSETARQTFNPRVVLGIVLFGALAFLLMLWAIGAGETGRGENDGGAHAAARGLNGYAALAQLLEDDGLEVTLARNTGRHTTEGLLVLTPPQFTDAAELQAIIEQRRYIGPTMVILPKWYAGEIPRGSGAKAKRGWVMLSGTSAPPWLSELTEPYAIAAETGAMKGAAPHWRGLDHAGKLPDPAQAMYFSGGGLAPLVTGRNGKTLVGYLADDGYYPVLDEAAGRNSPDPDTLDSDKWGVTFVAEPDLFNNYGMADRERADMARDLIWTAMEGEDLEVTFDLTLNGIGQTRNLLTLAFTPPFLAATLCLIIAMLVMGWRAFCRFGPPVQEERAIAFGKARLVANSAGFIQRTGRLHLLAAPFAALVAARLARLLRLRGADETEIDDALKRRGHDELHFSAAAENLRQARTRPELLRAARALKDIERNLTR